jgi:hypothetical protein
MAPAIVDATAWPRVLSKRGSSGERGSYELVAFHDKILRESNAARPCVSRQIACRHEVLSIVQITARG